MQPALFWLSVVVGAALVVLAGVWVVSLLRKYWRQWKDVRRRTLFEDALKHVLACTHEGICAGPESLAGVLKLPFKKVTPLIAQMESAGLLHSERSGMSLTGPGESYALQVVRAHRLWETYLAQEARMPLERVHRDAHRAEHRLSAEDVDRLDAHLGYPRLDPHGDPIPTASGEVTPLHAVPLTDWPAGKRAEIVHLEDEPEEIFRQIPTEALRHGVEIRVLEKGPDKLVLSDGDNEYQLPPVVARNIEVQEVAERHGRPEGLEPLSELDIGEEGEVIEFSPEVRGFTRRRLLDLGLTPSTRVRAHLRNAFGDPLAFRVRGTTIALRKEQADGIWVKRVSQPVQTQ